MQCACCDCCSEGGYVMLPRPAGGVTDGMQDEARWETDVYDFALDALEFEAERISEDATAADAAADGFVLTQQLEAPLNVGSHIVFSGMSAEHVERVTFNIGVGEDIAVHVDARLPQRCVVRNTRRRGRWGLQETASFRPFPFAAGRPFVVEALVAENATLWAVDGLMFCEMAHRDPSPLAVDPAPWIELRGARDGAISVSHADLYPAFTPPSPEVPSRSVANAPSNPVEPSWHANVRALLSQGVPSGHQLIVVGRLRAFLHSFRVDLAAGCEEWPPPEVALHVELRAYYEPQKSRQLVIFNSRTNGVWGEEHRQRSGALVPNTAVRVRIVRGGGAWRVYADGALLGELPYRTPADNVRALRLRGDLMPTAIYLAPSSAAEQ